MKHHTKYEVSWRRTKAKSTAHSLLAGKLVDQKLHQIWRRQSSLCWVSYIILCMIKFNYSDGRNEKISNLWRLFSCNYIRVLDKVNVLIYNIPGYICTCTSIYIGKLYCYYWSRHTILCLIIVKTWMKQCIRLQNWSWTGCRPGDVYHSLKIQAPATGRHC